MAFQKAALLSAVIASASLARAAPLTTRQMFPSSCTLHPKSWGSITLDGFPLSVSDSGTVVVGGNPQQFAYAVCPSENYGDSSENYGDRNLVSETRGYIVDAYDNTQCLTASNLDQSGATFSLEDCRFNGAGDVWSSQSFAWTFDNNGAQQNANLYFNGENPNYVNETSYPLYTLKTQYAKPTFEGTLGNLTADYTPNLTSLPQDQLALPQQQKPVLPPPAPASLTCSEFTEGSLIFNNQSSSSNTYDGPLNSKFEADSSTTDTFVFQQCDYSSIGIKAEGDVVYGRIRPGSDLGNGEYSCYFLTDKPSTTGDNQPETGEWIQGLKVDTCSYAVEAGLDLVKYNKTSNEIVYFPFGNVSHPGQMYWYGQTAYDNEYDVKQYVWDPKGVGMAYVSPSNANLTKYPPGQVTFNASAGAN